MASKRTPLFWFFDSDSAQNHNYIRDLDNLKKNSEVDLLVVSGHDGIQFEYPEIFHDMLADIVRHAHSIGIQIALHLIPSTGFFNASTMGGSIAAIDQVQLFPINAPDKASAIVSDYEMQLDAFGNATFTHRAKWARKKIAPIYCKVIRAYAFVKTADGFYREDSLCDVTDSVTVINNRTDSLIAEIHAGSENAGKNLFVMVAQYYNYTQLFGNSQYHFFRTVLDRYADIPLDGIALDEFGYLYLDTSSPELPFRGRLYSKGMYEYYRSRLHIDLNRFLFDMRYAPSDKPEIRIAAINRYFSELRKAPVRNEKLIFNYAKKLFGENIYLGTHATFHNQLDCDEVWHTGCDWWDVPTGVGHTDENIEFPVRMGIMLSRKQPVLYDMFYSKNPDDYYNHIAEGAPFGCREFHHALNDRQWGHSFTEPDFLKSIRKLDRHVSMLDDFITDYPRLDLAVIFGSAAQFCWYPNESVRNKWDLNGSLGIQKICNQIWNAGYRCALIPDYAIDDGRVTLAGNRFCFGKYSFDKLLFLYPQYISKKAVSFLNSAWKSGVKVATVGTLTTDFNAHPATLLPTAYPKFSMDILENLECQKSAIPNGCVYRDGSFSLFHLRGILNDQPTDFRFTIDGMTYNGISTGLLAYRKGVPIIATPGSTVFINGKKQPMEIKQPE